MNESNPLRGRITERGWRIEAVVRGDVGPSTGYCLMSKLLAMAGVGSKPAA